MQLVIESKSVQCQTSIRTQMNSLPADSLPTTMLSFDLALVAMSIDAFALDRKARNELKAAVIVLMCASDYSWATSDGIDHTDWWVTRCTRSHINDKSKRPLYVMAVKAFPYRDSTL